MGSRSRTARVGGSGSSSFGIDAYQEIEVKTGGYEAEYGRALGGVTSAVMKSGGNTFSGSLDVRYQADAFQESGDHFDPDLQENSNLAVDATFGGPIIRDRLVVLRRLLPWRGEDHGRGFAHHVEAHRSSPKGQADLADLIRRGAQPLRTSASGTSPRTPTHRVGPHPRPRRPSMNKIDTFSIGIDGMLSDARAVDRPGRL